MTLLQICEWLESTKLAELVTQSTYGFPIVVAIHLLGLGLSVGTVIWFDLRLLGIVLTTMPVSLVYRRLAPVMAAGFVTMFGSGAVIFTGYATAAYNNPYFRVKLAMIVLAGLNAAFFHVYTHCTTQRSPATMTSSPSKCACGDAAKNSSHAARTSACPS